MPDFTVIDGGGPEGRDRISAEQELRDVLQVTAANMLRVNLDRKWPPGPTISLSDRTLMLLSSSLGRRPVPLK